MTIKLKGSSDGSVSFDAPADTSPSGSDIALTLPTSAGSANQFLKNSDTAGTLEYSSLVQDSSGRLLVGTSSSIETNSVIQAVSASDSTVIIGNTDTSASGEVVINFAPSNSITGSQIKCIAEEDFSTGANRTGGLEFNVRKDGTFINAMRINSSGQVGIGSSSPNATFEVASTGTCSVNLVADSDNNGSNNDALISFHTDSNSGTANATIKYDQSESNLGFDTNGSRRLSIDSSGRLLSGVTSAEDSNSTLEIIRNSGQNHVRCQSNSLANGQYAMFRAFGNTSGGGSRQAYIGVYKHSGIVNPGAFMLLEQEDGGNSYYWTDNNGRLRTSTANSNIGTTGGTIVGTQTSDLRLKNVGANVSYGLAEVKQLQPKQYALKTDPDVNCLGFIAQEVESIIPEAVFDTLEELDGHQEGDRTKLGMEYVQLIPVLVNAIKELSAEVDTLKTKVAALEAA